MMNQNNRSKLKKIAIFALVLLILPVAIDGTKLIQDDRGRAAGSYEVGLKMVPGSGSYSVGDNLRLQLKINKIATRAIRVSGVQAVVTVGDKFVVNNATCLAPFNGLPFVRVNGQEVTIFCAIATGTTPVTLGTTEMAVATLDINVDPFATDGPSQITFNSTRVTESGIAGQAPDVSTAGSLATFDISSTPPCSRGELGNLDCSLDACIDTADFELFRQAFGLSTGELFISEGQSTPDLVVDSFNMVDTADYEIFRSHFGTCQ